MLCRVVAKRNRRKNSLYFLNFLILSCESLVCGFYLSLESVTGLNNQLNSVSGSVQWVLGVRPNQRRRCRCFESWLDQTEVKNNLPSTGCCWFFTCDFTKSIKNHTKKNIYFEKKPTHFQVSTDEWVSAHLFKYTILSSWGLNKHMPPKQNVGYVGMFYLVKGVSLTSSNSREQKSSNVYSL